MPLSTPPNIAEPTEGVAAKQPTISPEIFCAGCGYDLRGISSDRCPECGLLIDHEQSAVSRIPWVHRKQIGRARAYWRTVWLVTLHPKKLAAEMARPVSYYDARRFRLITVALAAFPIIAVLIWTLIHFPGKDVFSAGPAFSSGFNYGSNTPWPAWADLIVPLDAGVTFPPATPIAVLLALLFVSGIASYWFHPSTLSIVRQNRAVALSFYACAPLLWIWPFTVALVMTFALDASGMYGRNAIGPVGIVLFLVAAISEFLLPITLWRSTISLLRNTTHPSTSRLILAAVVIPISWVLCAAVVLVLLPFMVGYFRLLIASFN